MSQGGSNSGSGGGGSAITTINGDTGSITGSTVTIYADNAANNSGQSVEFVNSGTISTLNLTDANSNTALGSGAGKLGQTYTGLTAFGKNAGSHLTSGVDNTLLGAGAGELLTTGSNNVAIGFDALFEGTTTTHNTAIGYAAGQSVTGSYNILIGSTSGNQLFTTESNNILVGSAGVTGDNNVLRIGTQGNSTGQQNECYIAGITGATPVSGNTPQVVLCDNAGNLAPISSSTSGYVLTSTGPTTTPSFQPASGGGFTPVNWSVKLSGNVSNVTGDNTQYTILYDTVTFDSASGYNSGTGNYTIPTTGKYQISLTHFVFTGGSAGNIFLGFLLINGTTNVRLMDANPGALGLTANGEFMQSATFLYNATAGDTISANVQVGGGSKNVGVAGGTQSCLFSGFRVA